MNVNVNVNYTARATLQYKAQKETPRETPGPAQAFSRRLVGIGVIFVADNFTGCSIFIGRVFPQSGR